MGGILRGRGPTGSPTAGVAPTVMAMVDNWQKKCGARRSSGGKCDRPLAADSDETWCWQHKAGWRGTPATVIRTTTIPVVLPVGEQPLPWVQVAGTEFEITLTGKPLDEGEGYALTGPDGARRTTRLYMAPNLRDGSGLLCARAWSSRWDKGPALLDEDGQGALFLEDGEGGLTQVLRGSLDYREAESDALWANGWDPRLYFEDDAVIEIPDTAADVPETPKTYPLHVVVGGDIAAGRLTYKLCGRPTDVGVGRKDNGHSATLATGDKVRAAVQAAFDADRGSPGAAELCALYAACGPIESHRSWLTGCANQGLNPKADPQAKEPRAARDALLRLGALTFPENTSELTDRVIRSGFDGSVQDLYGAVTALLSVPAFHGAP